jgi:hypothetical protein
LVLTWKKHEKKSTKTFRYLRNSKEKFEKYVCKLFASYGNVVNKYFSNLYKRSVSLFRAVARGGAFLEVFLKKTCGVKLS